jgi:hypothetical protein
MKRKAFIGTIAASIVGAGLATGLITSCNKDSTTSPSNTTPPSKVDFTLDLDQAENAGLKQSGGSKIKDGTVWAWGDGQYGELGDSSKTNRSSPVQMRTTCNSGSGIQAIQEPPAVRVFPNPSTGKFSIDFPSNETINIQVYNIMGAMILQQQNTNEIDLSGAAKGLYLVKIYAGSKIYNTKVLIQ